MTAAEVKDALRRRHPALDQFGRCGQWTTLEEWHNIDLLAFNAWSSNGPRYGRVGYEVKVSRSDYRRELTDPGKRAGAVAFCHEFYFAVPKGLLKPEEVAWQEQPWQRDPAAFRRTLCPGYYGARCYDGRVRFGILGYRLGKRIGIWEDERRRGNWLLHHGYDVDCQTCRGKGWILDAPVRRAGIPHLWVPADVGLVEIDSKGCHVAKRAPRRKPDGFGRDNMLAGLVRHASFRPDPRHADRSL